MTALRSDPGEWYSIRTYTGTPRQKQAGYIYAHNCKRGRIKALSPAEGFEVFAQASEDSTAVVVWARYVGGSDE